MYVAYTIIILLIIAILVTVVTIYAIDDPEFDSTRSDNFNNVMYYQGSYNNQDLLVSPEFDWVDLDGKRYDLSIDKHTYTRKNKSIKFHHHPFFYVDKPILKNNIKKDHNIPKIIWQTLREFPKEGTVIHDAVQTFKSQKGWDYRFVTDENAKEFLKENFDEDVLHAFEVLIPGAYKADLLRACLLYIYGGVYADAKLFLHYDLDSFLETDLVLILDINESKRFIWNGFIAATPKNEYFMKIIKEIVKNVRNLDYKDNFLGVTGPKLYGKIFTDMYKLKEIKSTKNDNFKIMYFNKLINFKLHYINESHNQEIFISWDAKRNYTKQWKKGDYSLLWWNKSIYDKILHEKYFN